MDRNRIGAELDRLFDSADQLLCIRVGAQRCSAGKVDNQPDVSARAAMAGPDDTFVHQDSICATGYDIADRRPHIGQTFDRADRNTVVHRDNYRPVRIAVDYPFQSYLFAYHSQISNFSLLRIRTRRTKRSRILITKSTQSRSKSKKKTS